MSDKRLLIASVTAMMLALALVFQLGRYSVERGARAASVPVPIAQSTSGDSSPAASLAPELASTPEPPVPKPATPEPTAATSIPAASIPAVAATPMPASTPVAAMPEPVPLRAADPRPPIPVDNLVERFEEPVESWAVLVEQTGSGVSQTNEGAAEGGGSARMEAVAGDRAYVVSEFADAARDHSWEEPSGTFYWQRAAIYLPAQTLDDLAGDASLTLAGVWASQARESGWFLRVREGGHLSVVGTPQDGQPVEFSVFGTLPADRWVTLEVGLHSKQGPGVKRAFAAVVDGQFYGWFHGGQMSDELYDRAGIGVLDVAGSTATVLVDAWGAAGQERWPTGPDLRATDPLQTRDFRPQDGAQLELDWATWANEITLDPVHGLRAGRERLQAGHNVERMGSLLEGWTEIEVDWASEAMPASQPNGYFGPMVGFRKDRNREENVEIVPIGDGTGAVHLALEAWVGTPVILARWPLPEASGGGGSHIPEPGDIMRARWQEEGDKELHVQASYFDASEARWHHNIIDTVLKLSAVADPTGQNEAVDYFDGGHTDVTVTIDSEDYGIRRLTVGQLDTYPLAEVDN